MKQYIKHLALLLLAVTGITACNEQDMGTLVSYPDHGAIGNWMSEYASGDYDYITSLEINADGDTICSIQQISKETGIATNYFDGATSYDPVTGMTTVNFETTPVRNNTALFYLAFRQNMTDMNAQLFMVSASGTKSLQNSFVANPIKGFEVNHCQWQEMGKDKEDAMIVLFSKSKAKDSEEYEYKFTFQHGTRKTTGTSYESGSGSYTWDYNTAEGSSSAQGTKTVVATGDKTEVTHTYTFSINANNNLVVTDETGSSFAMERVANR